MEHLNREDRLQVLKNDIDLLIRRYNNEFGGIPTGSFYQLNVLSVGASLLLLRLEAEKIRILNDINDNLKVLINETGRL
jgi:hypothetical protein